MHAGLADPDFRGFVGREKNVVVCGVQMLREFVGSQSTTEMVTSAGGDMDRSEDFLVLNIASRGREDLGTEAEFA